MEIRIIQQMLSRCFDEHPDRIAVEHLDRQISYAQLSKVSNTVAEKLQQAGVKKGEHIGVLMEDRSSIIFTAIAIFKLGGVFVPLDRNYPTDRLKALANAADLKLVIVEEEPTTEKEELWKETLSLNKTLLNQPHTSASIHFNLNEYNENDPAYIYFTTGTTGDPKPIVGKNSGLAHFIDWEVNTFKLEAGVRISQLTSPSHDPYLRDVFTTLSSGGTICIPDGPHTILSPFEFKNWIDAARIELMHLTPTLFRNLCNADLLESNFKDLKFVLLAGEQLFAKDLKSWYGIFGERTQLVNLYGPSETTMAKLFHRISLMDLESPVIPIGKPISHTAVHILNEDLETCDKDEVGELYISTPFATLGYYKDDELTTSVFVSIPKIQKEILYRTGDFVKQRDDLNLIFVERKDKQVKIRGQRFELGEIESELITYSGVNDCTVQLFKQKNALEGEYLIAHYIGAKRHDEADLIAHLKQKLPDFMIPRQFFRVDAFPMNVNGKLDVANLLQLNGENTSVIEENGGIESALIVIWKEILERDELGIHDVFMSVGGDSLGIMQLIARIHSEFEFELSLWQIFDDLTIEKLAELIEEQNNS